MPICVDAYVVNTKPSNQPFGTGKKEEKVKKNIKKNDTY